MAETPSTTGEKRCAELRRRAYEGAAWCGMCFEPVAPERTPSPSLRPEPKPISGAAPVATTAVEPVVPMTRRRTVGTTPSSTDAADRADVAVSGLRRQEPDRAGLLRDLRRVVRVADAAGDGPGARRSARGVPAVAHVPGLGHRMIPGREVDGFARGVLFAMLLIATLMLGLSGVARRGGAVPVPRLPHGERARLRLDGVRGLAAGRGRRAARVVAGAAVGDGGDLDHVDRRSWRWSSARRPDARIRAMEHAEGSVVIEAPLEDVMEVIEDYESYPEWSEVQTVDIRQRGEGGRAYEVAFEVDVPVLGKAAYTLAYVYAPGDTGVSWTTKEARGAIRDIRGEYLLERARRRHHEGDVPARGRAGRPGAGVPAYRGRQARDRERAGEAQASRRDGLGGPRPPRTSRRRPSPVS